MACDIITENLIKGIIVANSRTGIKLEQIANVYYECTGEQWTLFKKGELPAIQYLEQIGGILSIVNDRNETLWYVRGKTLNAEHTGQIYRSNNQPKQHFDSNNPHGNAQNTCNQYNNGFRNARNNNNNNNNNNKYPNNNNNSKDKIGRTAHNGDINGNYEPRNGKPQKYNANNQRQRSNGSGYSYGSSNNISDGGSSTGSEQKTNASLFCFDLVGDDLFMEMAKIDLGCSFTNRKRIHRSGLCISGQRIRDAAERLKRFPNTDNMKIIVNLGTVDILHGRDFSDMCQDYMNLARICYARNIQMVITTLAPVANRMHIANDAYKMREFNRFLFSKFANKHQVIDIAKCMQCPKTCKVWFECYQPVPKYMSGTDKPHLLWNRIGRQRILKEIKANLRL